MIIKQNIKPEIRKQILFALGPLAWLAYVLSVFLGRAGIPDLDFVSGFLTGFAIVGNLAYIYVAARHLKEFGGKK